MSAEIEATALFQEIRECFQQYLLSIRSEGIVGIAKFAPLFEALMPEQQAFVRKVAKENLTAFLKQGSIVSLGICYDPGVIAGINYEQGGKVDMVRWDRYGAEYARTNRYLAEISHKIGNKFEGIGLPPVTGLPDDQVSKASDYYPHALSHRLVAEHAGVGWRGKSELLVTARYGPAVRFTSVLFEVPLEAGSPIASQCGECTACLDACPILAAKDTAPDYREACHIYLNSLGVLNEVCGKCILACCKEKIEGYFG